MKVSLVIAMLFVMSGCSFIYHPRSVCSYKIVRRCDDGTINNDCPISKEYIFCDDESWWIK